MHLVRVTFFALAFAVFAACGSSPASPAASARDASADARDGAPDAPPLDAATDSNRSDGAPRDAGHADGPQPDAGKPDGSTQDARAEAATASLAPGKVWWLMNNGEIGNITHVSASAAALAKSYFDNPTTYISGAPLYSNAVHALDFKAANAPGTCGSSLVGAVDPTNCASVASNVGAIVLDVEGGSTWCSAASEKQDPISAYQTAYARVRAYNQSCRSGSGQTPILLIATPGTDLIFTIQGNGSCSGASDTYHKYICLGIAGGVAKASDIYEVQAQAIQNNEAEFEWFVKAAAQQARTQTQNPGYPVLAGITADATRLPSCDASVLYADVSNTIGTVEGYWLNVFGNPCTSTLSDGQLGAALLTMMAQGGP